ncbi:class-II fumarase/aspartase family protein [Streptomyces antimicrobicus]|uniref:Adenylosuccinate lyase family protein n=1 Tax=Streptomyces antimicrobicus TaxID=2883108 RepID=A0ABS8B1C7_9ACTN|nr:adenylosuccinate lyase family protein [Streptomyces antimicrobicus]MCB5178389.1 adenylosuccinate lyase family protein [Streptomyces antimicrobicus]
MTSRTALPGAPASAPIPSSYASYTSYAQDPTDTMHPTHAAHASLASRAPHAPTATHTPTATADALTAPDTAPAPDAAPECGHERGHITDSRFYGHIYATETSRAVFCDICRFQSWLDIEAQLALAQAELGMIPQWAADRIAERAQVHLLDLDGVRAEIRRTAHSLVGLLRAFQAVCGPEAGEYIHYGTTTQDIQDTGQVLAMKRVLDSLQGLIAGMVRRLVEICDEHATTVVLGRTHAQPALPIGFGLKAAGWIDELLRHDERIEALRPRVLVLQLFGGAGSMAGFDGRGPELLERLADRLGLAVPVTGWHAARDRMAEYVSTLAMAAGTLGRIADEIRTLGRPEIAEVQEAWYLGKVGSSTMPHKRNPEGCEQIVVMARLAAAQAAPALAAMGGDHERDGRTLRMEWVCVPDVSHYTLTACEIMTRVLNGLTVRTDRALANVLEVRDQVATEGLMLAFAAHLGKQSAHERVYQLIQRGISERRSLRELIEADEQLGGVLGRDELDRLFDPARYLGDSALLTRRVTDRARAWLAARPTP